MTHQSTVTPKPADPATGSLAGFQVICADCGFVAGNTIRTNAEQDGRDHAAYMANVPKLRPFRDCWPHPCKGYHATNAHLTGEDPCICRCHNDDKRGF
jgi:hypothetical protein